MRYIILVITLITFGVSARPITVNQAVGFFYSKQVSHNTVAKLCVDDYSELEVKFKNALAVWSTKNKRMLRVTDEIIAKANKEVPQVVENMTKAGSEGITGVFEAMPSDSRMKYCNYNIEMLMGTEWNFDISNPSYFDVVDKYLKTR